MAAARVRGLEQAFAPMPWKDLGYAKVWQLPGPRRELMAWAFSVDACNFLRFKV